HTRFSRDWSPDVCSADLDPQVATDASAVVVVANGSARRGEKAPGHLDERSFDFDAGIDKALRDGDGTALTAVDAALAVDLLADRSEERRVGKEGTSGGWA